MDLSFSFCTFSAAVPLTFLRLLLSDVLPETFYEISSCLELRKFIFLEGSTSEAPKKRTLFEGKIITSDFLTKIIPSPCQSLPGKSITKTGFMKYAEEVGLREGGQKMFKRPEL